MDHETLEKLDNPVWNALTGMQQEFAIGTTHVKRFQQGILAMVGYDHHTSGPLDVIDPWLPENRPFYMVGTLPTLPAHWQVEEELPCLQMISVRPPTIEANVAPLTAAHRDEMFRLVNKVQPGLYEPETPRLGNYYGIWDGEQLVAIAGERMRFNNLVEVSAVCTDPAYTGRGYAQHLVAHVCNSNLEKGMTPILHVLASNERAIKVYELLGFKTYQEISFWKMKK
jgi:GNAT superfamily N-acetyltransferase